MQEERGKGKQPAQKNQQEDETTTAPRPDVQALVTELEKAKEKSAKLRKQIQQKDKKIDRLQNEINNARTEQRRAIDNNKLGEARECADKYAALSTLCDQLEREREKLEGKLKASRTKVKELESELENSREKVQKLQADLDEAHNKIREMRSSALVIPTSKVVSTEQNIATEAPKTSGGPSGGQSVKDASTQDSVSTSNRATNGNINREPGRGREKENASRALSVVSREAKSGGVIRQRRIAQAKRAGLFLLR